MLKKMNIFAGIFVASLFASAHAATHEVPYNTRYEVNLADGDELLLKDFPSGWGYSNVFLGVNATPGGTLSGSLTKEKCVHNLDGNYQEIVYGINGEKRIKYSGKSQRLPIQWWVGEAPTETPCSETLPLTLEETIAAEVESAMDAFEATVEQEYLVLESMDVSYTFEGNQTFLKIKNLPTFAFNMINVQIEPLDNKELKGLADAGNGSLQLQGWTETLQLQVTSLREPVFQIIFPENRKVKFKWWVSVEAPVAKTISSTVTNLPGDLAEVVYDFSNEGIFATNKSLKIKYAKSQFKDGAVPTVKKYDIFPSEVSQILDKQSFVGDFYDIHAEAKEGEEITVSIPISWKYEEGVDSIYIAHYLASEHRWEKIKVDSIVDNYAYFRTTSFSIFAPVEWLAGKVKDGLTWVGGKLADGASWTWEQIKAGAKYTWDQFKKFEHATAKFVKAVVNGVVTVLVSIVDGVVDLYKAFASMVCGDWSPIVDVYNWMFPDNWSMGQGSLSAFTPSTIKYGDGRTLEQVLVGYANLNLTPISSSSDYSDIWKITSDNLDIVLADLMLMHIHSDYQRRFSFVTSENNYGAISIVDSRTGVASSFETYFQTKDELLKDAEYLVEVAEHFYGALNLTGTVVTSLNKAKRDLSHGNISSVCKNFLTGFGLLDWANDFADAYLEIGGLIATASSPAVIGDVLLNGGSLNPFADLMSEKDDWLQNMSSAMLRVGMLAWLDKSSFRTISLLKYSAVYDGMMSWLDLASPIYGFNNLSIKANAALALYEFVNYGTSTNLNYMNYGMSLNYGENGGFSEGAGYSQYIWDEVPYAIAALQAAYASENKPFVVNEKFLKSAQHMLDFSRPVKDLGLVPVEADDGVTYNPDYMVWSKIFSQMSGREDDAKKYVALAAKYPLKDAQKILPMLAIGVPNMIGLKVSYVQLTADPKVMIPVFTPSTELQNAYKNPSPILNKGKNLWGAVNDGMAMITVVRDYLHNIKDTISLSMLADNGYLFENGQAHDQQDNLSVTLASSMRGFIIHDRGYSGFTEHKAAGNKFSRYHDHNVVTKSKTGVNCTNSGTDYATRLSCIDAGVEEGNHIISKSEIETKAMRFSGTVPGAFWSTVPRGVIDAFHMFNFNVDDLRTFGGAPADFYMVRNESDEGLVSMSANYVTVKGFADYRTIMYYKNAFWVIDRPNAQGGVWMASSPLNTWSDTRMQLYGSSLDPLGKNQGITGVPYELKENNARSDFEPRNDGKWYQKGYWYTPQDDQTWTYAMVYPVGNFDMVKTDDKCPQDYQCFESQDKQTRVVIPPRDYSYDLRTAFEDCNIPIMSNAVVIGEKAGLSWMFKSIDGSMIMPNGQVVTKAQVTPGVYYFWDPFGNISVESVGSEYLPALPLLLL